MLREQEKLASSVPALAAASGAGRGVFRAVVWYLNGVDKVPLVSREGQTFEKGVVTEVLQDNLQPDGSRVGEQVVRVRMTTGVLDRGRRWR